MDGQASISPEILARYAGDAARDVPGVHDLAGRRPVKVDGTHVEVHLVVDWGASIQEVGTAVRDRVREYLRRMARVESASVDVVVDDVAS
ncbi:MAG: Asp23/Gls24 family envelope stress response protein [Actinomycetota bacterium]